MSLASSFSRPLQEQSNLMAADTKSDEATASIAKIMNKSIQDGPEAIAVAHAKSILLDH